MREFVSTITTKGQATIPVEVRRLLGVAPHDKIAFLIEDGKVRLVRSTSVVHRTAGAFKSEAPPMTAEELREAAEQAIAEDVLERGKRWW